jgi:NitT/TauT family transport system ATP-binding protein
MLTVDTSALSFDMSNPLVRIEALHKSFHRGKEVIHAVSGMDISIGRGEVVAIIGPSGCGKSTLLHMIAGLYLPTSGTVYYNDQPVVDVNTSVAYMTQKDNLLPWRKVLDNVALPLEILGVSESERTLRAKEVLDSVGLSGFEDRYSSELSGGMRKRACLARMLLQGAECFLLDEPFAALDAQLKLTMHDLLLRIAADSKKTIVFVTHDLVEAVTLADRVFVCTKRPATIAQEQMIPLARPRDVINVRFEQGFKEIYESIWARLRQEYQEDLI